MKTFILVLFILAFSILWPTVLSLGACPEAPNDNGICDTMYVDVNPPDVVFAGSGTFVRVAVRITHDISNPVDSLTAFIIPFCYTHSNPSKYCSLTYYWNNINFFGSSTSRSIFRYLDGEHNWMMDQAWSPTSAWSANLDLDGVSHFWLVLLPGSPDAQRFEGGSRILIATMTFRVQDTMTICIDTCFWPPSDRLCFSRSDAVTYIPRHNLPYCFQISSPFAGDANGDGTIDVSDIVYLINYLFRSGASPIPINRGDANCDQTIDVSDVVFLINYLFRGGPAPSC